MGKKKKKKIIDTNTLVVYKMIKINIFPHFHLI